MAVVLLLPVVILLSIWVLLAHKVTSTPQVSSKTDSILPIPPVVEQGNHQTQQSESAHDGANRINLQRPRTNDGDESATKERLKKKKQSYKVKVVNEVVQDSEHAHMIPNVITFTHSVNLLNATTPVTGEDVALQRNVQNTLKLHPGATVHFLTDKDCIASIKRVMGEDSPLVSFFQQESHGMYKADICRGAALYETGGLYFDVDIQARMSMWDAVNTETIFVTPMVHRQSKYPGAFFQAFIGVTPKNPIMLKYLELFLQHYQGHIDVQGPLGVLLLRQAHDAVGKTDRVELWQEVLYNKQLFPNVPPPSWGTRRACHFVVVANRKRPFVVPLYSRCQGSRMCGGKESLKNLRGGR